MNKTAYRIALVSILTLLLTSALVLVAGSRPMQDLDQGAEDESFRVLPGKGFQKCPVPACMAPCKLGQPPEVLCKGTDGSVEATTYFCCCCGGGGNSFKPF